MVRAAIARNFTIYMTISQAARFWGEFGAGRFDGLFDDSLGIRVEKGHIWTDYRESDNPTYATSVAGIHAIGDVIGPPWLAHVSSEEAVACARKALLPPDELGYVRTP